MTRDGIFYPLFYPKSVLDWHFDRVQRGAESATAQELSNKMSRYKRRGGLTQSAILIPGFVSGIFAIKETAPVVSSLLEKFGMARPEALASAVALVPIAALAAINVLYIIGPGFSYVRDGEAKILAEVYKNRRIDIFDKWTGLNQG